MDCGSNSCLFATKKGGMRTNGGCMCLDDLPREQARELRFMVQRHNALQKDIEQLRKAVVDVIKYDLPHTNDPVKHARDIWLVGPWKKLLDLIPTQSPSDTPENK